METSSITTLAGAFIGFAILIVIGVQILGNVQQSTDCSLLSGGGTVSGHTTAANATGWSAQCFKTNSAIQNGYSLLTVAIIVIAAVIIMFVVKML